MLITHEMHVIQRICDSVSVMEDGRIVEQNDVSDVFVNPQHPTTKKFLETFGERQEADFLLEELTERFNVKPNIIHAQVIKLKNSVVGHIIVHVIGEHDNIHSALKYLEEQGVGIDVIHMKE